MMRGVSTTLLISSSSMYKALVKWKPRTLAYRMERRAYLLATKRRPNNIKTQTKNFVDFCICKTRKLTTMK